MTFDPQFDPQKELDKIFIEQGLLEKTDKKYAIKLVEQVVFGLLAAAGLAVIAKFMSLI